MYLRHGSLGLCVVCFARLSIICSSFRANAGYERDAGEECLHVAHESKKEESDFESLVLEDPSFSFLEAQEFFLSDVASCERTLEVQKPLKVPMNEKSKRAQLQQRYVVKHIKDSLISVAKMDISKSKDLRRTFLTEASEFEGVPAVELHMYPGNLDVNSTWRVLLIPRLQELFGETVFLCKASSSPETSKPCVAKLTFKRLPLRLMHLFGRWRIWSPSLDPLRGAPHELLLSMELLLLAISLFMLWHVIDPLQKILRMAWESYNTPKDYLKKKNLLESSLPKTWMLLQHAYVYKAAGEAELVCKDALDACTEVKVLETMEAKSEQFSFLKSTDVWGRLEDPAGWIVLVDSGGNLRVICKDEPREVPFCANVGLLVPFSNLLRRQVVLAACHTSVQWFLLESLAKMFGIGEIMLISVSLFLIHLAVVFKIEVTNSMALEYEEVLETKKKLLELQSSRKTMIFLTIALIVLFSTVLVGLVGLAAKRTVPVRSAILPCISLVTAVFLHLMDFRTSLRGIKMWRSPQLKATECTFITAEGLKSMKSEASEALEPETLSKSRRLRLQVVRLLTWLLAIGALSLLILIVLDGVQMRGELVDYSFGRGYITTPPHSLARQNSLLLHSNVDSLPFTFSTAPFTSEVKVRLEHPLLEVQSNQSVPVFNQSDDVEHGGGEYSIPLPSGPLYGRLIVEASSHLHKKPTRYVIHLIRIGEAVTVSLKGQIDIHGRSVRDPPVFEETRRWHYQEANPRWYVPDLDVRQNTSIQLEYRPTIFAPLAGEAAQGGYLSMFADECQCHDERAGFGNACSVQQWITFPSGESICLFQHHLKEELVVGSGPSFISSNASKLTKWLLDVNVSGKSAGLRLTAGKHFSVWPLKAEMEESKLRSVFTTSMQTNLLLDQASQLVLAPTQDMTDAEVLAVPLEVISHPPRLNVTTSHGFLLPNPLGSEERADLAACCVQSLDAVSASVEDSRFEVIPTVVSKGLDCSGRATLKIKELKVVRKQNTSCEPWCTWYRPWSDYYDMSVTLSLPHCFDEAIALENVDAFNEITTCAGNQANEMFDTCGTLRNAVYLNRTTMVSEMLAKDAKADGGDNDAETPLEAAASRGNVVVMEMLLKANANLSRQSSSGSTALVAGVLNCQSEAVKFLLEHGVDPNSLTKPSKGSRCQVTPLLALFMEHGRSDQCQGENSTEMIKVLVEHHANLSIPASEACESTQTALVLAVGSWDASAVEQLLKYKANPNEPGRFLSEIVMEPFKFLMKEVVDYGRPVKKVAKIAELLEKAGANVNVPLTSKQESALHKFADMCNVEGVELLLKLKADPNITSGYGDTAKEGAEYVVNNNECKNPDDKERLIKAFGLKEE